MNRRDLALRYDYSIYACFRCIDRYNDGFINSGSLGSFLRANGHYASERELLAIIRRIDTDGDAKLSFSEWEEFLRGIIPPYEPPSRARGAYSEERRPRYASSTAGSPIKG